MLRTQGGARTDGTEVVTRGSPLGAGALTAKPLEEAPDAGERARRVGDDEIARALEHAAALPTFEESQSQEPTGPGVAAADPAATSEPAEADPGVDVDGVIAAFNQLLRDAGLTEWKLLTAEPRPEDHALGAVVLAHCSEHGTTTGSLAAEQLKLERDPVTGVAGIQFVGAKGYESGVEIAFENASTRFEIPGILPLNLLAPCLRDVFFAGVQDAAQSSFATGDQVTRAINQVLALEKSVSLRIRSVDRIEEKTLRKAVIDLAFDEHGAATQTVLADVAWFELDPVARYGELHCDGGEMVEKGQRRPLFRGKLRLPLRDIKPEQWQGVPATRLAAGS
jgi:hypothetical protein